MESAAVIKYWDYNMNLTSTTLNPHAEVAKNTAQSRKHVTTESMFVFQVGIMNTLFSGSWDFWSRVLWVYFCHQCSIKAADEALCLYEAQHVLNGLLVTLRGPTDGTQMKK